LALSNRGNALISKKRLKEIVKSLMLGIVHMDWQIETKSKKLTVKGFVATVVLTVLGCLGLFGVMLLTLILTQSGTAVLIAIYAYGAIIVLLCTIPRIKKWRTQT